jgi:hypothetical protein
LGDADIAETCQSINFFNFSLSALQQGEWSRRKLPEISPAKNKMEEIVCNFSVVRNGKNYQDFG